MHYGGGKRMKKQKGLTYRPLQFVRQHKDSNIHHKAIYATTSGIGKPTSLQWIRYMAMQM